MDKRDLARIVTKRLRDDPESISLAREDVERILSYAMDSMRSALMRGELVRLTGIGSLKAEYKNLDVKSGLYDRVFSNPNFVGVRFTMSKKFRAFLNGE